MKATVKRVTLSIWHEDIKESQLVHFNEASAVDLLSICKTGSRKVALDYLVTEGKESIVKEFRILMFEDTLVEPLEWLHRHTVNTEHASYHIFERIE